MRDDLGVAMHAELLCVCRSQARPHAGSVSQQAPAAVAQPPPKAASKPGRKPKAAAAAGAHQLSNAKSCEAVHDLMKLFSADTVVLHSFPDGLV